MDFEVSAIGVCRRPATSDVPITIIDEGVTTGTSQLGLLAAGMLRDEVLVSVRGIRTHGLFPSTIGF